MAASGREPRWLPKFRLPAPYPAGIVFSIMRTQ